MHFRVQPMPMTVLPDAPFKNDRLNRKEPAEVLTRIVSSDFLTSNSEVCHDFAPAGCGLAPFPGSS